MLRSFYAKISLLFLILVILLGGTSLIIAFNASRHLFDEVEQLLNKDYAQSIAGELSSLVGDEFTQESVGEAIHYMMVLNPMVEIYLTDSEGTILAYFAGGDDPVLRERIDIAPLEEFTASGGYKAILGDDPRTVSSRKPFSAAPLVMGEHQGWVYVILRGQSYDHSLALVQFDYYLRSGLITFLIATLATLVVGLILFFILTNRLRRINAGVRDFKEGKLESRIEIRGKDELSQLGTAFNEMAQSIEEGIAELTESEALRRQLTANISHDLRSPLASIRGHLETLLMKENSVTEEERREFIEITLRNVDSFQRMVEELLDLARLEARQIQLDTQSFSLAELIQDIVLKLRSQSEGKLISMNYVPDPDLPLYSGDIGLIERALTNIIGNAVEHTPQGGRVTIKAEADEHNSIITVTDTGEGIPEQDLPHIFERFYRADKSRTRHTQGAGLGLAIAKEVAELHGGTLAARNAETGGAMLMMSLPFTV